MQRRGTFDTKFVNHEVRDMRQRNVTIVLGESAARWLRVEAARSDTSVSKYVGELVERERRRLQGYDAAGARFLSKPPRPLAPRGQRLPTRAEVHER